MKDFTLSAHISKALDLEDCYEACFRDPLQGARLLLEKTSRVGQVCGHMLSWHRPPDLCQHGVGSGSASALSTHGLLLSTPSITPWFYGGGWEVHAGAGKDRPPFVLTLPSN